MAKTKPTQKKDKKREKSVLNRVSGTTTTTSKPSLTPEQLLLQAAASLQQGDLESAVKPAKKALGQLDATSIEALPALNLLGEIHLELGDIDAAREYFMRAVVIDPEGDVEEELGGGPEKFLWLAQLSEEGGQDSVNWFEKGARSLRKQIQSLLDRKSKLDADGEALLEEKRRKLSVGLCGVVEVYMTDLSWEPDAEQKCEQLVTEATMVAEGFAEPWQTLANVRISQERMEDARAALKRSMELWKDLEPDDSKVPEFPARVSLARLLMETGMDEEAIEVLERLVGEDDQSVEVWYLGGWGLYILGEKQKKGEAKSEDSDGWKVSWISSRQWLNNSMRLFEMQDYEDDRLGEHARELLASLSKELGPEGAADEDDGDDWQDAESDDEEMDES